MQKASYWIEKLGLTKHPEGGWYKETYRSETQTNQSPDHKNSPENRSTNTCIYYLLNGTDHSCFHRLKSDESWHYYTGTSAIRLFIISEEGELHNHLLGQSIDEGESFQLHIPRNRWFAAELTNTDGYALVGCTVAPGFDFQDFEMATFGQLSTEFPEYRELFERFTSS